MPEYASSFTITFTLENQNEYKASLEIGGCTFEHTDDLSIFKNLPLITRNLEAVHKKLSDTESLEIFPYDAVKALIYLYEIGIKIWYKLIGNELLIKIWGYLDKVRRNRRIVRIEVLTPPYWIVPIEILPLQSGDELLSASSDLLKSSEPSESKNSELKKNVFKLAYGLAGFTSEIRYLFLQKNFPFPSNDPISFKDFMPLLFLWYEGSPMAEEAKKFIFSLNSATPVKPDGAFPNNQKYNTPKSLAKLLIEQGASSARKNICKNNGIPADIVHIHAHGEVPSQDCPKVTATDSYHLIFRYKSHKSLPSLLYDKLVNQDEEKVIVSNSDLDYAKSSLGYAESRATLREEITLLALWWKWCLRIQSDRSRKAEAFNAWFVSLAYYLAYYIESKKVEETFDRHGPFIFINACRSNAQSYIGSSGFAKDFLKDYGYRAVIGPTITIPGSVAEYIARHFYTHLLDKDKDITLALALLQAKRDLLEEHNNPLGMLYTIFGQSLLKIRWPD